MNPDPEKLRALLDDVLPASSEHCGPSSGEVLTILRGERKRRLRLQNSAALLALAAIVAGALHWNHKPSHEVPLVVAAPPKRTPIVIHQVNDDELLALLKEMPVALLKGPDGGSTLLVIEQASTQ